MRGHARRLSVGWRDQKGRKERYKTRAPLPYKNTSFNHKCMRRGAKPVESLLYLARKRLVCLTQHLSLHNVKTPVGSPGNTSYRKRTRSEAQESDTDTPLIHVAGSAFYSTIVWANNAINLPGLQENTPILTTTVQREEPKTAT
ncbi:hypothetical protein E2C01_088542 [Portunus trituberculatus]|uniref:Uncharacterized protein n=1 Tax=Portunus trituberculatus TaxID=210409 RepID=A0A5B7JGV7_PORTR|nr:hypothetical protein [Portunus trituberculatus]